jgi:hypothetical protein
MQIVPRGMLSSMAISLDPERRCDAEYRMMRRGATRLRKIVPRGPGGG